MTEGRFKKAMLRGLSDYGMVLVLLVLCGLLSVLTWAEQYPNDADAGQSLGADILAAKGKDVRVLIVVRAKQDYDAELAEALRETLVAGGATVIDVVKGKPSDARAALKKISDEDQRLDVIAGNNVTGQWLVFRNMAKPGNFPNLAKTEIMTPKPYWWPDFLKLGNLVNVTDNIVVIAILAIGVTMVIITGGIDLSVGSLVALSAVTAALLIRDVGGALDASGPALFACALGGIILCGLVGLFSGTMITVFDIPPFIVTLAMLLVGSGIAYILSNGEPISNPIPLSFKWLGGEASLLGIPNAVVMAALLYIAAHIVMTRTKWGRYIYAVGGNAEAARLSGVPVLRVKLMVYAVSGALAGLGGVVLASRQKTGTPTYGNMYELYTIAAVVVGGTSLAGGEGRVLGTLIGALIIAVIRNGMNLTNVEPYKQKVILGLVILGAVLLDAMKRKGWWKKTWSAVVRFARLRLGWQIALREWPASVSRRRRRSATDEDDPGHE